ncbi:MAG: MFS transporter [Clostridium sp.]
MSLRKTKSLKIILLLCAITNMALNMAHPVTPMLIRELALPSIMFGVFFATMSIGNFIFSPVWGKLSDSRGRIKFLVIGILGYGISQLGFGFSSNQGIIVLFRFLAGAFVISYLTVIIAYISDLTTKSNRLKIMTYFTAATTIGSALGSLFGGVIGNSNYKITFLVQFIICVLISAFIYFGLNETIVSKKERGKVTFKALIPSINRDVLNGVLLMTMIQVTIFYFSSTSYNSSINYYIESVLSLPPTVNGIYMAIVGIFGFGANLLITPILGRKLGEEKAFKLITLTIGLLLGIAVLFDSVLIFFIFMALFVCGCSIYIPIQQNIITKLAKNNYGEIVGIQNSAKAVGMIGGSLFSGFIFDYGSKLPFLAASILLIIGFVVLNIKSKRCD